MAATHKQTLFALGVWRGMSYADAAKEALYGPRTDPSGIAERCRELGLLPDPKGMLAAVETIKAQAAEAIMRTIVDGAPEVAEALVEAAQSGNVPAIKEVLDRIIGPTGQRVAVTGADGGAVQVEAVVHVYIPDNGRRKPAEDSGE